MYKIRRFSADKVLGTNSASSIGFTKGRKYDMDLNRLSKIKTSQDQLSKPNTLNNEMKKLNNELKDNI